MALHRVAPFTPLDTKPSISSKFFRPLQFSKPSKLYGIRSRSCLKAASGNVTEESESPTPDNVSSSSTRLQLDLLEQLTSGRSSVNVSSSSTRLQLDLLEQLTSGSSSVNGYERDGNSGQPTIGEQLANLVTDRDDDFSIPLGKNIKKVTAKYLTVSQKRNIRRQEYMNVVSQRNDVVFFATIGGFVLVPPLAILAIAIATGQVQLFP